MHATSNLFWAVCKRCQKTAVGVTQQIADDRLNEHVCVAKLQDEIAKLREELQRVVPFLALHGYPGYTFESSNTASQDGSVCQETESCDQTTDEAE